MSQRRLNPDPLSVAHTFADEAERARGEWRRALVANARVKIDEAKAGLGDSEAALRGYVSPVMQMMRSRVEARRREIERAVVRLDALDQERVKP